MRKELSIKEYENNVRKFPLELTKSDGFYPFLIKCPIKKDFFRLPFENDFLSINRNGVIFRFTKNKFLKISLTKKGYGVFCLRTKKSKTPFLLHRILAMMFIPIPLRHRDKTFEELQVNHIDGNKLNNSLDNLEWVTGTENMIHAHDTGLIQTKISVSCRNILTNEIKHYESIISCCKEHCLDKCGLRKHINSKSAGMIIINGFVFKLNNGSDWPKYLAYECEDNDLWTTCDVIGKNILTNEIMIFSSLRQACDVLKLNFYGLQNSRFRKGFKEPFCNWIFYPLDNL